MEGGLRLGKLLRGASRLVACIAHLGRDLFHEVIPDAHLASIGPVQILQLLAKQKKHPVQRNQPDRQPLRFHRHSGGISNNQLLARFRLV